MAAWTIALGKMNIDTPILLSTRPIRISRIPSIRVKPKNFIDVRAIKTPADIPIVNLQELLA